MKFLLNINSLNKVDSIPSYNHQLSYILIIRFVSLLNYDDNIITLYNPIINETFAFYITLYRYLTYDLLRSLNSFLEITNNPYYTEALIQLRKYYNLYNTGEEYNILYDNEKEFIVKKFNERFLNIKFTKNKESYDCIMVNIMSSFDKLVNNCNNILNLLNKDGILIFHINNIESDYSSVLLGTLCNSFNKVYININKVLNIFEVVCIGYNKKNDYYKIDVIEFFNKYINKSKTRSNSDKKLIMNIDLKYKIDKLNYKSQLKKSISLCKRHNINIKQKYNDEIISFEEIILSRMYQWTPFDSYRLHEDPSNFIDIKTIQDKLDKLSTYLGTFTYDIESRYIKIWESITLKIDIFRLLPKYLTDNYNAGSEHHKPSNAFCKIYELIEIHKLIEKKDIIKCFHMCEAPGNFIFGTNHWIKTNYPESKYEFYGNSLNHMNEQIIKLYPEVFEDNYKLMEKYPDRWLYGDKPNDTGDITDVNVIKSVIKKLDKVDFMTGDCGLSIDQKISNNQDKILGKTNFAQIVFVLSLLNKGGSFVIKHFLPMNHLIAVSYCYMITTLFDEVYLTKPVTSRPSSREIYIIGKKYKGIEKKQIDELFKKLDNYNHDNVLYDKIPESFYYSYLNGIHELIKKQIISLNRTFYFYDNPEFLKENEKQLLKSKENKCKLWCLEYNVKILENKNKL
jgi:hypothetical protein